MFRIIVIFLTKIVVQEPRVAGMEWMLVVLSCPRHAEENRFIVLTLKHRVEGHADTTEIRLGTLCALTAPQSPNVWLWDARQRPWRKVSTEQRLAREWVDEPDRRREGVVVVEVDLGAEHDGPVRDVWRRERERERGERFPDEDDAVADEPIELPEHLQAEQPLPPRPEPAPEAEPEASDAPEDALDDGETAHAPGSFLAGLTGGARRAAARATPVSV